MGLTALTLFGVGMIYSAGVLNVPSPVVQGAWLRQLMWFAVALTGFSAVRMLTPRWLEWAALWGYVVAIILLAATLVIGTGSGTAAGVKSFIRIGPLGFQPAEVAKIATILIVARLMSSYESGPSSLRDLLAPAALVALPLGLVVLQPDLGSALAFVGILFAMLFWGGTPL